MRFRLPLTIIMGNTWELEEICLNKYMCKCHWFIDDCTGKMHLETPLISSCHILSIHPHFLSDWNVETAGPEGNITGITRILSKYQQGEWSPQHVCKCTDTRTHSPSLASYFSLSTWPFRGSTQHHFSSVLYRPEADRASYKRTAWWEVSFLLSDEHLM